MGKEAKRGPAASNSNDANVDKRVLQNRLAQRAFRERKENRIKELEAQVAMLQSQLTEATEGTIRRSPVRTSRPPEDDDDDLDAPGQDETIMDAKMASSPTDTSISYTQQPCSTCEAERRNSAAMAAQLQHLEARVAEIQNHNEALRTLMINYRDQLLASSGSHHYPIFQPVPPTPGSHVTAASSFIPNMPIASHLIPAPQHAPWKGFQLQPSPHSKHPSLSSAAPLHPLLTPLNNAPILPFPPEFYPPRPGAVGSPTTSSSSSIDLPNLRHLDLLSQDSLTGSSSSGGSLGSGNSSASSAASSMRASKASRAGAGRASALRRVDASGTAPASAAASLESLASVGVLASSISSASSLASRMGYFRGVSGAGVNGVVASAGTSPVLWRKMSTTTLGGGLSVHAVVGEGSGERGPAAELKFGPAEQEFCRNALRRLPSLKDLPEVDMMMDAFFELGRAFDEKLIKQCLFRILVCKDKILDGCNEIDRLQAIEIFSITHSTDAETAAVASSRTIPNFSNVRARSTAAILSTTPSSLTASDPGIRSAALFRDAVRFVPSLQGADNLLDELIDAFVQQRSCTDPEERKEMYFHMLVVRGKLADMCTPEDKSKFMYALELARQANKGQAEDF